MHLDRIAPTLHARNICSCAVEVIIGVSSEVLQQALVGLTVSAACRKAKHLWVEFGPDHPSLLLHFGENRVASLDGSYTAVQGCPKGAWGWGAPGRGSSSSFCVDPQGAAVLLAHSLSHTEG